MVHPILHNIQIPISNATVRSGTMCPSNTYGNPGISRSHTCVDFTIVPSGKLILRGFVAGCTFFIGVSFMTIIDIAPVSGTACVMGIVGLLGGLRCRIDTLEVTTFVSSLSLCILVVGYKVGDKTNDFTHLCVTCFAPHRHVVGN
jgi:hypothetical protein